MVQYKPVGERTLVPIQNQSIQDDLNHWLNNNPSATLADMIDFATQYSTNQIKYTFEPCSTNPNEIILGSKKTNCVGYSAAFHTVMTFLLHKKGMASMVKIEHKVGQLYLFNWNMHRFFTHPSFKDHDYNVITDLKNNDKYALDPTVYATFGVEKITEHQ